MFSSRFCVVSLFFSPPSFLLGTRGRAKAYLWMIVLGGLFYLLPSLQTAGAQASGMLTSGNRDVCFFNEECMFPLQTFGKTKKKKKKKKSKCEIFFFQGLTELCGLLQIM